MLYIVNRLGGRMCGPERDAKPRELAPLLVAPGKETRGQGSLGS